MAAVVPKERMAGAMGVFTAVVMAGTVVLTFVGGTLASAHWRMAFLLIPAVCLVCLVVTPVLLPRVDRITGNKLDLPGQGFLMAGVVLVLYSASQFAHSLTSPRTLVPLVLGALLLGTFFIWESRYEGHFYPVGIFRSPVFLAALCAGFIYTFGTAVAFLQVTNQSPDALLETLQLGIDHEGASIESFVDPAGEQQHAAHELVEPEVRCVRRERQVARQRVERLARQRRRRHARLADEPRESGIVEQGLRRDDLVRLDPRDLRPETRLVGLAETEGAGRNVERGKAVDDASLGGPAALHGEQDVGAARLEQPLLGDRSRRDGYQLYHAFHYCRRQRFDI